MTRIQTKTKLFLLVALAALQNAVAAPVKETTATLNTAMEAGHVFLHKDSVEPSSLLSRKNLLKAGGNIFTAYNFFNTTSATVSMLGTSKKGQSIEAYFFPGRTKKRALIIGGMHGSELSSIEIARELIRSLQKENYSEYEAIVIPCLFPDNAQTALDSPSLIGSIYNIGRYTENAGVDPNRQMPSLGKSFDPLVAKDHLGRSIENENQLLLQLISSYHPDRIINIHAIRNTAKAGVYADPRTDAKGIALGFEQDSLLAINMAKYIKAGGGCVLGNQLATAPSSRYPNDPSIAHIHQFQPRSTCGSSLPSGKGCGVSLGSWATTAVEDKDFPFYNRDAITLITMEFPGYKRPQDYALEKDQKYNQRQVKLYASSIKKIFLAERKNSSS
jgi:hypothetical protein